jgi:hypothetical protein
MAKLTAGLELRKSADGRRRVVSRDLPERYQFSIREFADLLATGHVNEKELTFDTAEGGKVRYRILPMDPDHPTPTVIDLVLVGSSADVPDAIGGRDAWDAWLDEGGVTTVPRAEHAPATEDASVTDGEA